MHMEIAQPAKQKPQITRAPGGKFAKGVSGNPGGRTRLPDNVKTIARQYTEEAMKTLADIMRNSTSDSARVQSAQTLLDRGWGKALQQIEIGDAGAFSSMSDEELLADITLTLRELKQVTKQETLQ